MNTELQILPEIADLLPPLSEKEFDGIETDILQRGVLAPLVIWNDVLVDGHHRYKICEKHSLPFHVRKLDFDSIQSAKLWAWQHQENRRNLTPFQRIEIALQFKPQIAENAKKRMLAGKKTNPTPTSVKGKETRDELAALANVGHDTVVKAEYITANADELTKQKLRNGDTTINAEYKRLKKESELIEAKQKIKQQSQESVKQAPPAVFVGDGIQWLKSQKPCDLLLTDPPYMTDVIDIDVFVNHWLPIALAQVKPTGSAYVFTGAYPRELKAYLNVPLPENIELVQVLVWTYKNTLGNNPTERYKQNWQAILYFRGKDALPLDCPLTAEQWSVIETNAPDGRLGNRFHAWQKPDNIAEKFIRHSTKTGDTVFDPFCCTGTFLLAAAKLGRIGMGAEINLENSKIAIERGCIYAT
jgi:hypothetical protein